MNKWLLSAAAGAAVFASTGCVDRAAQQQAKRTASIVTSQTPIVDVQAARIQKVVDNLEITGDIITGEDTNIGPKQSGKISAVFVKEGDTVSAGQLLASMDTSQLQAQLRQAQAQVQAAAAAVSTASSNLEQARRNAAAGPQKSSAALASAQAQLRSARAQLTKAKAGARPEEIAQDEANVRSAQANVDTQQKQMDRIQTLVKEGALAASQLDTQRAALVSAQSQLASAQQALKLAAEGARAEDIVTAEETVQQAQEAVKEAKVQKNLDPLLQDQVRAAQSTMEAQQSQLDGARANVALIMQNISDMEIRSPLAGKVLGKAIQPGTVVAPGATIVRVIGGGAEYFNGDIPASVVDQVKPGLSVNITVDGIGGKSFGGVVDSVSPIGAEVGRLFTARVNFIGAPAGVRPGMFARGTIRLKTFPNATMVPIDAVVSQGDKHVVFYVDGNVAKSVEVKTGVQNGTWMQVSGLPAGVNVVVAGQQSLSDGEKVMVKQANPSVSNADAKENQG